MGRGGRGLRRPPTLQPTNTTGEWAPRQTDWGTGGKDPFSDLAQQPLPQAPEGRRSSVSPSLLPFVYKPSATGGGRGHAKAGGVGWRGSATLPTAISFTPGTAWGGGCVREAAGPEPSLGCHTTPLAPTEVGKASGLGQHKLCTSRNLEHPRLPWKIAASEVQRIQETLQIARPFLYRRKPALVIHMHKAFSIARSEQMSLSLAFTRCRHTPANRRFPTSLTHPRSSRHPTTSFYWGGGEEKEAESGLPRAVQGR